MKAKKLPKWAIPAAVGVLLLIIFMRKKANNNATEKGAQGLTNQSFIPVTGENIAGAGAPSPGGGAGESTSLLAGLFQQSQEQNKAFQEYLRESQSEDRLARKEEGEAQRNFTTELFRQLGTGGGAPSTGAAAGSTVVQTPSTQGGPTPPAPPASPECAPGFPFRGPHGCWRWSRVKGADGCACAGYQSGRLDCQHKRGGVCTW